MKKTFLFLIPFFFAGSLVVASSDIEIDTDIANNAVPTSTSVASSVSTSDPSMIPTVPVSSIPTQIVQKKSVDAPVSTSESVVPTALPGQGVLQMRGVYQAGIDYYKQQDFAKAIRYLEKSLDVHDPYTPKFYYAEANAMLGVIYQFHIIDKKLAYEYYLAALKIDPQTRTAKKHIRELSDEKKYK